MQARRPMTEWEAQGCRPLRSDQHELGWICADGHNLQEHLTIFEFSQALHLLVWMLSAHAE